ncbi:MAG TPA: transglutaminase-like domain-containing protein, partial [Candidatus Nanoarchaeia archaeon]|nr:transglutaminase-like domain-containing protein [Candidatus Nanoarchaeia archaeon]
MKKIMLLSSFILFLIIPLALADWFHNSENVIVHIDISGDAEIVPAGAYVDSASVNLSFFPKKTGTQDLVKFTTEPIAEVSDKTIIFKWKNPPDNFGFKVSSDVKTTNTIFKVNEKINFPIADLPDDIKIYTKPSATIDSDNEAIIQIASELVKGEDDLYSAVFKLAQWTKSDVNYNLSTMSLPVTQKASEVLKSRQGVCGDISSLFMALARSVGIPARFVSGIAYTNSDLFPEKWGAHGWAEVYFPSYGWVPFDVTYGEFGWIDPTHIRFKDSVDSDEASTYYQWVGRNADLKTGKLEIKTELIDATGIVTEPINIEANVLKKSVGFGSYNIVEAAIENTANYYYSTELYLSKPREITIIGNELKSILLLPHEKKTVFWIIKLGGELSNRYEYTFPLVVGTLDNTTSETSFESDYRQAYVSQGEMEQAAKLLEEETQKKYSGNVMMNCSVSKNEFYEYENVKIYCTAKNTGNIFLSDANICFEDKCKATSLGISQEKNFVFELDKSSAGEKKIPIILKNELVSKASYVNFKINDAPKIEIINLKFPNETTYDDKFQVEFTLTKKSLFNPKEVELSFFQNGIDKKWIVKDFNEDHKYVIDIEAKQLKYGSNDYEINVNYKDGLAKSYNTNKEFSISLTKVTLLQRLLLFSNGLGKVTIIIVLAGFVAFGG